MARTIGAARGVFADHQGDAAVRVYVIAAVLGIVFKDEEGGRVPEGRVGDGFDRAADGEVVIGDRGFGRGSAGTGAGGVVVGQPQQDEVGHGVFALLACRRPTAANAA